MFIKIAYPNANQQTIDELKFPSQPYSPVRVASLLPKDELQKFGILANPYRVLVLANADGKLLCYYSNSQDTIYSGEQSERKDGKYNIDNETRQVA